MERKDKDYVKKVMGDSSQAMNRAILVSTDRRIDEQFKDHEKTSWGHNPWIGMFVALWLCILTASVAFVGMNQFAGMEWHCTGDKVTVYSAVCHAPPINQFTRERTFTIVGDKDSFDLNVKNCRENGWEISDFTLKEMCTGYEYLMKT